LVGGEDFKDRVFGSRALAAIEVDRRRVRALLDLLNHGS
jgi:hypothetical protein